MVIAGISLARRLLPQQHPLHRKATALAKPGRVVELGRLLLAAAFVIGGAVITYVYS